MPHYAEEADLYLVWDDYVAQGVLSAFLARGIRLPEDVRLVSQSNFGLGPVYPKALTRFEENAAANGETVAAFCLSVLAKRPVKSIPTLGPTYVIGDSFRY